MKPQIVFFDCDGVLIFGNPWVTLHREMNISEELDKQWFDEYQSGKITFDDWAERIDNHYRKEKLSLEKFKSVLNLNNFKLNREARELIAYLKNKQIPTAIISNAIDYYVEGVAKHFNIDYWYANSRFIFDQKDNFEKIKHTGRDESSKIKAIEQICLNTNTNPLSSLYVGDSINDLLAFNYTKKGILYETKSGNNIRDNWTRFDDSLIKAAWKRVNDLNDIIKIIENES